MTHLLSLAALHAEHPDAPSSVFGPDGDFEGAPTFSGPVFEMDRPSVWWPVCGIDTKGRVWSETSDRGDPGAAILRGDVHLDLRVPSVAARLALLCARALGEDGGTWSVEPAHRVGRWHLRATDGRTAMHRIEGEYDDAAAFLAALTLALAPRIAALRMTP